jgi:peptidyl-prolyl cis-trans isomerase A (cyclophilin A)
MMRGMLGLGLLVLTGGGWMAARADEPASEPPAATAQPEAAPSADSGLRMLIETSLGDIVVELDVDRAPNTVDNFLMYATEKFYDGTIIHRVIPNFIIQGGGYANPMAEKTAGLHPPIRNEWANGLKHKRMTIAAARVPGKPDSATSQFFINVADNPRLDQPQEDGAGYAVFGRVVGGEDVVEKICSVPLQIVPTYRDASGQPVTPVTPIIIKSVRVEGVDVAEDPEGKAPPDSTASAPADRPAAPAKGGAQPSTASPTPPRPKPANPPAGSHKAED